MDVTHNVIHLSDVPEHELFLGSELSFLPSVLPCVGGGGTVVHVAIVRRYLRKKGGGRREKEEEEGRRKKKKGEGRRRRERKKESTTCVSVFFGDTQHTSYGTLHTAHRGMFT